MSAGKKIYERFSSLVLGSINTTASLIKVLFLAKRRPDLPAASGGECIVLGNGPSLKTSLQKSEAYFQQKTLLCVNTFSLSDEYVKLKPRYYVMMDPGLWRAENELVANTMEAIRTKTTWELHVLVPHDARVSPRIRTLTENTNIRVHYINYVVYKGFTKPGHWLYRRNLAMPQSQNVLVASLFLAINLGYKRIELFGADHNWHEQVVVNKDNVVCLKQVHFYENETQVRHLPFYKAMHLNETFRMDEAFHAWAKVFHGYFRIRAYADSRGSRVINRSVISFVDAFEREEMP